MNMKVKQIILHLNIQTMALYLPVFAAEMSSLLRDLAESLDEQEGESADQARWRQIYTSRETPDLFLGPVVLKNVQG